MARHAYTKLSNADARALRALVGAHGFTRVARIPRDLVAMYWRIKYLDRGGSRDVLSLAEAKQEIYGERLYGPIKLYRVTVWRKR